MNTVSKIFAVSALCAVLLPCTVKAEDVVDIDMSGYAMGEYSADAGNGASARLAAAAGTISAAMGDEAAAGKKLEELFSGSGSRNSSGPVSRQVFPAAAPAPVLAAAMPAAPLKRSVVPTIGLKSADDYEIKPSNADEDAEDDGDAEGKGEAGKADEGDGKKEDAKPDPFWHTMVSGMFGALVVMTLLGLVPVAPLVVALALMS